MSSEETEEGRGEEKSCVSMATSTKSVDESPMQIKEEDGDAAVKKEENATEMSDAGPPSHVTVRCGVCGKDSYVARTSVAAVGLYMCDICKSRAQKKERLQDMLHGRAHPRAHEPVEAPRRFPCAHCAKMFHSLKDMRRHARTHTGEKPYRCNTCGRAFSQNCSLKRHLLTHSGAKPHQCRICGLTFRGHLARHMRSHTGERPFTCEVCKKGFYRSEGLKKHLAAHLEEGTTTLSPAQIDEMFLQSISKEHRCNICDKTYANSGHLARHMRQHEMEAALPCGVCAMALRSKGELLKHLATHSKAELASVIAQNTEYTRPKRKRDPPEKPEEDLIDWTAMKHKFDDEDGGADAELGDDFADGEMVSEEDEDFPEDEEQNDSPKPLNGAMLDEGRLPDAVSVAHLKNMEEQPVEEHDCTLDRVNCGICGHACCCPSYISVHMRLHEDTAQPCQTCGVDFPSRPGGGTVCEMCTQKTELEERHQCLQCDEVYQSVKQLNEHMQVHVGGYLPHQCQQCPMSFVEESHLQRHLESHKGELVAKDKTTTGNLERLGRPRLLKCHLCQKTFGQSAQLKRHVLNVHLQDKNHSNPFQAPNPDLALLEPKAVSQSPSGVLYLACAICGKVCKGKHLGRHMRVHLREGETTPRQELLEKRKEAGESTEGQVKEANKSPVLTNGGVAHVGQVTGDDLATPTSQGDAHDCLNDKVNCGICGFACCCTNFIPVHMRQHEEQSAVCETCGRDFTSMASDETKICRICTARSQKKLRLHQILRSRVTSPTRLPQPGRPPGRPRNKQRCPHCPKSFSDRKYLREHIRVHTGERRYRCDVCGAAFAHSRNYKRHMWNHSGEKPNWCDICQKGISGHLARHMRSHTGEKRYFCGMCAKGFNRSEHLKRHMRTHVSGLEKEFNCRVCGRKYQRREHLKRHIKTHFIDPLPSNLIPRSLPLEGVCDAVSGVEAGVGDTPPDVMGGEPTTLPQAQTLHNGYLAEQLLIPVEGQEQPLGTEPAERPHDCTRDPINCGICGEACCCANYIPRHMRAHDTVAEEDDTQRLADQTEDGRDVEHTVAMETGRDAGGLGVEVKLEGSLPKDGGQTVEGFIPAQPPLMTSPLPEDVLGDSKPIEGAFDVPEHKALGDTTHHSLQDEEFDWASVANFLQSRVGVEPIPPPAPSPVVNGEHPSPLPPKQPPPRHQSEDDEGEKEEEEGDHAHSNISTNTRFGVATPLDDRDDAQHECSGVEVNCEICGLASCCVERLIPHLTSHTLVLVRCDGCEQNVDMAKTVVELRGGQKIYRCEPCFESERKHNDLYGGQSGAEEDGAGLHPGGGRFACPDCGREHRTRKDLNRHRKIHAEVKPFKCDTCGKEFISRTNLKRHLDTHAGLKLHKCEVCGLSFSGHLARHMRTHTGEKHHICEICLKGFQRMEHLKRHLRNHLKEGNVPSSCTQLVDLGLMDCPSPKSPSASPNNWCHICCKVIPVRMARHMRMHSAEKPFRCGLCPKAFNREDHLKRHMFSVHARHKGGNELPLS